MSALYTAVKLGDAAWRDFTRALDLGGVASLIGGALMLAEHRGLLRLDSGEEVGFLATNTPVPGQDGVTDLEILVDDANEAKVARLEAEVTRLRAELQAIADLQLDEPRQPTGYEPDVYYHEDKGRYEAAEMARKALVQP